MSWRKKYLVLIVYFLAFFTPIYSEDLTEFIGSIQTIRDVLVNGGHWVSSPYEFNPLELYSGKYYMSGMYTESRDFGNDYVGIYKIELPYIVTITDSGKDSERKTKYKLFIDNQSIFGPYVLRDESGSSKYALNFASQINNQVRLYQEKYSITMGDLPNIINYHASLYKNINDTSPISLPTYWLNTFSPNVRNRPIVYSVSDASRYGFFEIDFIGSTVMSRQVV